MYTSLLTLCVCGDSFNLQHALSCPKGGIVITRHNKLRNLTAENRMCNGMSSFLRKICFIQEHRRRVNNYCQPKNIAGAESFSFHICQYIEEMIMLRDLLLF